MPYQVIRIKLFVYSKVIYIICTTCNPQLLEIQIMMQLMN